MKCSVGIDIVDVKDFCKRIKRTKNLANRLFTKYELDYCKKKGIEHLASRFAAKEAFAKACNLQNMPWHDVEVRNSPSGKPFLNFKSLEKFKIKSIDISISNIKQLAVAIAIINY